jgi:hypothetical protein
MRWQYPIALHPSVQNTTTLMEMLVDNRLRSTGYWTTAEAPFNMHCVWMSLVVTLGQNRIRV